MLDSPHCLSSGAIFKAQRGEFTHRGCTANWRQRWGSNPGLLSPEPALVAAGLSPTLYRYRRPSQQALPSVLIPCVPAILPLSTPPGCLQQSSPTQPASPTSTGLERCSRPRCSPVCPAAALPTLGPFWLAISSCRQTMSSIFLTTQRPPIPPLNELQGSFGWSTAEACTDGVGN